MIKETLPLNVRETKEEFYNPNKSWLTPYDARDWFMKYSKINELLAEYGFNVIDVKGTFYIYSEARNIKLTFDTYYLSMTKQIMEEKKGTHKLGVVYLSRNVIVNNSITKGYKGEITIPLVIDGTLVQEDFFPFIENAMKELNGSNFYFK